MSIKDIPRELNLGFGSGALGALASSAVECAAGQWKITSHFSVSISPTFTWDWLYPRLVVGGLFGILFVLPLLKSRSVFERGLILGLVPTLFQLLYVFKFVKHYGYFGFELGALTPVFIFLFGCVWGWTTALWCKWSS
jgi:hypothetical protein